MKTFTHPLHQIRKRFNRACKMFLLGLLGAPIEEFTQQKKFQQYLRLPNSTQDR